GLRSSRARHLFLKAIPLPTPPNLSLLPSLGSQARRWVGAFRGSLRSEVLVAYRSRVERVLRRVSAAHWPRQARFLAKCGPGAFASAKVPERLLSMKAPSEGHPFSKAPFAGSVQRLPRPVS